MHDLSRRTPGSDFSHLARNTAAPVLNGPVGVLADPFGHFELPIHDALAWRHTRFFEVEVDVFAVRRLVNHADSNNEFDHCDPR